MTTLAHLYSDQLIVTRLTTVSGFKKDYATITSVRGSVQPLSPNKTNLFNGVMGKTYRIFVDGAVDITENDKLRDIKSGAIYKVKNGGVSRRISGAIDYNEVIIELVS